MRRGFDSLTRLHFLGSSETEQRNDKAQTLALIQPEVMHWWQTGKCTRLQSEASGVRLPDSAPISSERFFQKVVDKMAAVWYLVSIMKIGKEIPIKIETDRYLLTDSMKRQSQHWFRPSTLVALLAKSVYINERPDSGGSLA